MQPSSSRSVTLLCRLPKISLSPLSKFTGATVSSYTLSWRLSCMISLTLQCSPIDMDAAVELIQLICWCEHKRREETEFFLVYRKDCPLWLGKEFEKLTSNHFGRSAARMARNH